MVMEHAGKINVYKKKHTHTHTHIHTHTQNTKKQPGYSLYILAH